MKFQKALVAGVVLGVALFFCCHHGWAGLPAYMHVEGSNQGVIEGSCTAQGREGMIVVYSLGHNVVIPIDPATGRTSGARQHNPLKILKEIDKSSPKLFQALCTGERMGRVRIDFYRIDPNTRQEALYFTILLEDAMIVSISPSFPTAFLSQNESYRHMETVSFIYETIKWTWLDGNIEYQDQWRLPVE